MGIWKTKSKPLNIHNVIMLHIVARQQKNIAKKSLLCAFGW